VETFTIENTGTGALMLTGSQIVTVSGSNAADFTVTQPLTASVSGSGAITFTVAFHPPVPGLRTAAIAIGNDSPGKNPILFRSRNWSIRYPSHRPDNDRRPGAGPGDGPVEVATFTAEPNLGAGILSNW